MKVCLLVFLPGEGVSCVCLLVFLPGEGVSSCVSNW